MRQRLKQKLKQLENRLLPKALVLMYHRVATVHNDPWDLVVSPQHFRQQLEVLSDYAKVLPLQTLCEKVFDHSLGRRAVAITFDDGYRDNYYHALPCLQAHAMPATFFIVSGTLNGKVEFWWDDLERLLLLPGILPEVFRSASLPELHGYLLGKSSILTRDDYEGHRHWKAWEKPLTPRHALYVELWKRMKAMPRAAQMTTMDEIARWAGAPLEGRTGYLPMTGEELGRLGRQDHCELGAHTRSHAQLSRHSRKVQAEEIIHGRDLLEEIGHKKITCFSYPYGDFNSDTTEVVKKAGFSFAFTTEERVFNKKADSWAIPRFQVKNWDGDNFRQRLSYWIKQF